MQKAAGFLISASLAFAAPAIAADLGDVKQPDGSISAPATTIGLEVSPSFFATNRGPHVAGNYDDTSIQISLAHRFDSNFVATGLMKAEIRPNGKYQYYAEARAGYRFDFGRFVLTPTAALGDTWKYTGLGSGGEGNALYYALYLAGDWRIDPKLTWNAFELRYRNAFDYIWITPEVTTGLTYAVSDSSSVYGTAGYSWKDTGAGLYGDTFSVAVGLKHSF